LSKDRLEEESVANEGWVGWGLGAGGWGLGAGGWGLGAGGEGCDGMRRVEERMANVPGLAVLF
jgi:hypothetical protein